MKWGISIFTADGKRLLFAAQIGRVDARELATEARRLFPRAQIFLRSPTGQVSTWP
jgi:hypothetical protein